MNEEKDEYNIPLAAFTFGKNGQALINYSILDLKDKKNESIKNNNISVESKDSGKLSNERFSFKNIINKNNIYKKRANKDLNNNINHYSYDYNRNNFIFIDKGDSNSSYIKIILYALSYMNLLSNYIINEIQLDNEISNNNQDKRDLLLIIRDILTKIDQIKNLNNINKNILINNIINIEHLKEKLSELFKNENKFWKDSPDDPMDFLYVLINYLHDLNINKPIKKICDECFSHKNLSMILYKVYECECKAESKLYLTNNNYFLDIPINIIINKFSEINITGMNQMLFNYYQKLIYNVKIKGDCPKYGNNCKINKLHKKYFLKRCPSYLIFNLENDLFKYNELFFPLNNILKNFILIPHLLNISTLFNLRNKNDKIYYELIGILFLKISKTYSCLFKSKEIFYYYEDNIFLSFNNYYDIILFSLKNGNIPIAIIYQNISLNNVPKNIDENSIYYNTKYELTNEQINKLEKYVKNVNNFNKNLKNKIRTNENIFSDFNKNYEINTTKNISYSDYYTSSRYSNSVNSYNLWQKNEYLCNYCERINKIENPICFFCGLDNKNFLNNVNDNVNNNKTNNNKYIRKLKNNIIIKRKMILKRKKSNNIKNKDELVLTEDDYKNIDPHVLKYFDMPHSNIPSQKSLKNNLLQKQNLSSKILNKRKMSNLTDTKASNIKINNSPNLLKNYYINKTGNKSFKTLNKHNKNNFISYTNRNSNNTELNSNISNSEFYSEKNESYNNRLNINLKINNNNNYNIFEFGGKNRLINLDNNKTDESYLNNNNELFKEIDNKIKTKNKIVNYNLLNKSQRNKSRIINENRINFNNILIGQMSTKNKNRISKI